MTEGAGLRIMVAGTFEAGSPFAHAINVTKMAEGFARLGHEGRLLCRQPSTGPVPTAALRERTDG